MTEFLNVPLAMRESNRWLNYRLEPDPKHPEKPRKVPMRATQIGVRASSTDPKTWASFNTAIAALFSAPDYAGPGFALGDGWVGVDCDHCVDGDGIIAEWALAVVRTLDSYTEYSPSGTGIHIIAHGALPKSLKWGGVEMYDKGRYFTVTGRHVPGSPIDIRDRTDVLAQLHAEFSALRDAARSEKPKTNGAAPLASTDDFTLIDRAKTARNGFEFSRLWAGDCDGYGSQSEADLALANNLMYWTDGDVERADRLFRSSGLMRDKWDERRGELTYGEKTLALARKDWRPRPDPEKPDLSEFLNGARPEAPALVVALQPEVKDIPADLLTVPGTLGDVVRYGLESSVRPIPIFAVQAALALGSIVCGRRYVTSQQNYSSLYFLNVAKSGTGKEHAKTTIENILLAANADHLLGSSSYSSGSAVYSALLAKPQHITIVDEFGHYLEAASNQRENWKTEVLSKLMEAFGRCHGRMLTPQFSTMTVSAQSAESMKPKTIVRPAITLLAMTTPSTFYDSLRSTKIQDGFLNRFIIAEHQGPRVPMVEWKDIPVPHSITQWVRQLLEPTGNLDSLGPADTAPDPVVVELTPKAFELSSEFEREMLNYAEQLEPQRLGDMAIRAREIALRLALIVALSDTPDDCMVTADCLEWSIRYVRFFLEQTVAVLHERVSDTTTERTRNVILSGIRIAGSNGITLKELNKLKPFVSFSARDRKDAIESLITAELIAWVQVPTKGRPRTALVAIQD